MTQMDLHLPAIRAPKREGIYARFGKRALDILLCLMVLPVVLPIAGLLWLCVRREGPGLYGHRRIGQGGQPFTCWKLRTMHPNSDRILEAYLEADPEAAREWAQTQKLARDPRVTGIGRFLRRTSLDELPQIWNILRGDMSLVGPRPITLPELRHYAPDIDTYLDQKPGLTGIWQVRGRSNGCFRERVAMDGQYRESQSLAQDLVLLLSTTKTVLSGSGR